MKIKSQDLAISSLMSAFKFLSVQLIYMLVSFLSFIAYDIQLLYLALLVNAIVIVLGLKFNNQSEKTMLKRFAISMVFDVAINIVFLFSGIRYLFLNMIDSYLLQNSIISSDTIVFVGSSVFFCVFPLVFILLYTLVKNFNPTQKLNNLNLSNYKIANSNLVLASIVGVIVVASTTLMIRFATYASINLLYPVVISIIALCSVLMLKNCKRLKDTLIKTSVLSLFYVAQVGFILTNINP